MALLRDSPDDLFALVGATSQALGLRPDFVEKDFWVTEVLRSVAVPIQDAFVVFKGGTSLLKSFGIIERMSEDVDLLMVVTRERDKTFGKGSIDKILEGLCQRVADDLDLGPDAVLRDREAETGVHRSVRYIYPVRLGTQDLTEGVLLELGVRGGPEPNEVRSIASMVADHATRELGVNSSEFDEFAPVSVRALSPERTLIEKLSLLHELGVNYDPDSTDGIRRSGRHVYDVYQLLGHEPCLKALRTNAGMVAALAAEICRMSEAWKHPSSPRPDGGFAASPIFDASEPCHDVLRGSYESARMLIFGRVPSFEECLERIGEHAETL